MKRSLAFSLLSAFLTKFSVASPEAAIDDIWATDPISPNTYSDFDPASTPYDETQGSVLDENLITDPESYTGSLADGNTGCSGNIEPSAKRRREDSCVPGADIHLALPQSPFETLEQKNRINLDLDPIRFPGVPPQFTQMDSIYCGNEKFVVCDSARENDKQSNGDGKYRLLNARRGMIPFRYLGPILCGKFRPNNFAQSLRDPFALAHTRFGAVKCFPPNR